MRNLKLAIVLALATAAYADIITLKSGRVINGTYLGGTSRQIKVEVADEIQTLEITDVARIEFGNGSARVQARDDRPTLRRANPTIMRSDSDDQRPTLRRGEPTTILHPDADPPPVAAQEQRASVEIPEQTNFVVRLIDAIDSEKASLGQSFNGSMAEPVIVNGETVIPRGADVVLKLVDSKESGKLTGKAVLTVNLSSVKVNGKMVDINSENVSRESSSRGEKTAKTAGGGAVAGAVLGGILGGGKGAAVGAATGAGAGVGYEIATKGQRVRIPSETRLTFVLETAIRI